MSFILDALKKSESDRQRKNRPESAYIPTGTEESSSPRWLLIVGILLLINVVVLLVVYLKPDRSNIDVLPATETENPTQADSFRDLVANARNRQAGTPATNMAGESVADTPVAPPAVTASAPAIKAAAAPSTTDTAYRTYNEVRAAGSVQLPNLHMDLHVFDESPAKRFVFINTVKYAEQETLAEGPLVQEIVPEGVILEYLGTEFLVPRE